MIRSLAALPFGALALAIAAAPAPAAAEGLSQEARTALRSEIRDYLMENPEVIMEALRELEKRRRTAEQAAEKDLVADLKSELTDDGYSHVAGAADGDVTVVEFLDYNCGYCKRAHEDVKALVRMDGNIRYVIKEFPILGEGSMTASRAAMAAQLQGADYYEFHDALMSHRGRIDMNVVERLARASDVDVDRMKADMDDPKITERILRNRKLAQQLRIEGTPTFVIGGKVVRGYVPLQKLEEEVKAVRDAAEG